MREMSSVFTYYGCLRTVAANRLKASICGQASAEYKNLLVIARRDAMPPNQVRYWYFVDRVRVCPDDFIEAACKVDGEHIKIT
jgi:hypothetical protein